MMGLMVTCSSGGRNDRHSPGRTIVHCAHLVSDRAEDNCSDDDDDDTNASRILSAHCKSCDIISCLYPSD